MPPDIAATLIAFVVGCGTVVTLAWIFLRHRERRREPGASGGETDALRTEMADLRSQVETLEERLDFAERLLAQQKDRPKFGGA